MTHPNDTIPWIPEPRGAGLGGAPVRAPYPDQTVFETRHRRPGCPICASALDAAQLDAELEECLKTLTEDRPVFDFDLVSA